MSIYGISEGALAPPKVRLGARIAEVVAASGLTQKEVARRIGVTPNYLSDLVRDVSTPSADVLCAFRREFRVSVDWLLTGEGSSLAGAPLDLRLFDRIATEFEIAQLARVEHDQAAERLLAKPSQLGPNDRERLTSLLLRRMERARLSAETYNEVVGLPARDDVDRHLAARISMWLTLKSSPELVARINARFDALMREGGRDGGGETPPEGGTTGN